jgi:hypothetical protein
MGGDSPGGDSGQDTNEFTSDADLDQISRDADQIASERDSGQEDTTDSLTARDLQQVEDRASRGAETFTTRGEPINTPITTLSPTAINSLPISQTNMMQGADNTDFNFARSNAAQQLIDDTNLTGGFFPAIDAIAGFRSQGVLNDLNRGQVPTFEGGNIIGTTGQGFGMASGPGSPNPFGPVPGYEPFSPVVPTTTIPMNMNDGSNNNNETIIRRNPSDPVQDDPTEPPVSDELASDYLQNPFYLYSGQNNLYQPYGYAANTLVNLLRTRNMTQPQQAAANLGLFGNPGDFS